VRKRRFSLGIGLIAVAAVVSSVPAGVLAAPEERRATPSQGDPLPAEYAEKDNRPGAVAPTAPQRSQLARSTVTARWNRFGTPAALTAPSGELAGGLSADPETAARQYLGRSRGVFGLAQGSVDALETVGKNRVGKGSVVLLRQRFGKLPAAHDGLVAVAVKDGSVLHVTSSLTRDAGTPLAPRLSGADALRAASSDAGIPARQIGSQRVRLVAVPMPGAAPRAAYEVVLMSRSVEHPLAYTTYVDARTGKVLVRENLVDFAEDNPQWKVFPATPPGATDTRQLWCLQPGTTGCQRVVSDPATGKAWDIDHATGLPTNTSVGNAAETIYSWGVGNPPGTTTPSATRDYTYPFTNQWADRKCDPATLTSPERADVDAATANLFAMHNRMHDWSYHLGFNESAWNLQKVNAGPLGKGGDAEQGRAQQGAATQTTRNNANQATPPDGMLPVTNMYMWQPFGGGPYPPCVDGDFDMTVIGHEYTHAITNRMIAGPDGGITSFQGGAMGESWSDLMAMEYLFESGYTPRGRTPYVTGAYVTGDLETGIRNYDMSNSPLNYSNVGYDRGAAVHADGEIWSATNFDVRRALIARYGAGTRSQQEACASGQTPADQCPGNRRWAQLAFDSFLLQATGNVSMLDMRDNMITADALRFDGANADLLWNTFAARGFGAGAVSGPGDVDPEPSFASPYADNIESTFRPLGDGKGKAVKLYVGNYESGSLPVADTDPDTALPETVTLAPGTYQFLAVGKGLGHKRFSHVVRPGGSTVIGVVLGANLASMSAGATATGDGSGVASLIDDTEASVWDSVNGVAGKQVTVDLAEDRAKLVARVQVSAFGRTFTSLRSFQVLTCDASRGADCTKDESYRVSYTSAPDAFPGGAYRPKTPQLVLRSFPVRPTLATHVRLKVVHSQCTGGPLYAGEQDNDPRSATDCSAAAAGRTVNAAEFQVFSF
jgi:extracellular elastinolytic metalloproteinase